MTTEVQNSFLLPSQNNTVGIMSESNYLLLIIPKSRSSFTIIQVLQGISEPLQNWTFQFIQETAERKIEGEEEGEG